MQEIEVLPVVESARVNSAREIRVALWAMEP
jgi:hypothetical protein